MNNISSFGQAIQSLGGYVIPIALIAGYIIYWILRIARGSQALSTASAQHTETAMAPVLISSLLQNEMFNGLSGETPKGYYFTYIISSLSLFSKSPTVGMYSIELPYKSGAHLVGLPKKSERTVSVIRGTMEPVVLEGDYPAYFDLYADENTQTGSRYVMDPAAMIFTVDFCQAYEWEILDDTLYFVSHGVMPGFEIVDRFIDEIRPAIEVPSDRRKNPYKMSYIGTSVRTMQCPVCQTTLLAEREWMRCPNGDGYLITGSQLADVRRAAEEAGGAGGNDISHVRPPAQRTLTCPYCANPMVANRYSFTPVMIDICSRCMYRWVDSNEVSVVFGEDPTLVRNTFNAQEVR